MKFSREYVDLSRGGAIVAQGLDRDARRRLSDSYATKPWQSLTDVPVEFRDAVALAIVQMRRG